MQSVDEGETAAADDADQSLSLAAGGSGGLSGSQKELVNIMEQVKSKHLTVREAEDFFSDWKIRHERSRSFKQKQVSSLLVSS